MYLRHVFNQGAQGVGILLLSIMTLLSPPVLAAEIEPDLREKIVELLDVTGVEQASLASSQVMIQEAVETMRQFFPALPERSVAIVTEVAEEILQENTGQLFTELIPLYAKYFTSEDIDEILAFSSSPAGQKFFEVTPLLLQESVLVSSQWARDLMPELILRVQRRLTEEVLLPD